MDRLESTLELLVAIGLPDVAVLELVVLVVGIDATNADLPDAVERCVEVPLAKRKRPVRMSISTLSSASGMPYSLSTRV